MLDELQIAYTEGGDRIGNIWPQRWTRGMGQPIATFSTGDGPVSSMGNIFPTFIYFSIYFELYGDILYRVKNDLEN